MSLFVCVFASNPRSSSAFLCALKLILYYYYIDFYNYIVFPKNTYFGSECFHIFILLCFSFPGAFYDYYDYWFLKHRVRVLFSRTQTQLYLFMIDSRVLVPTQHLDW